MSRVGEQAQIRFATGEGCPHLSGPRGRLASLGGRFFFRHPPLADTVSPPRWPTGGRQGHASGVPRGGAQAVEGVRAVHLPTRDAFLHPVGMQLRGDRWNISLLQELLAPRT